MALGMEVDLGPGDFVFNGDLATPRTEIWSNSRQLKVFRKWEVLVTQTVEFWGKFS